MRTLRFHILILIWVHVPLFPVSALKDDKTHKSKTTQVELRWGVVEGAKSYLLEFALDKEFSKLIQKLELPERSYTWTQDRDGVVFWRVTALGLNGKVLSKSSEPSRIEILSANIEATPPSPLYIESSRHDEQSPTITFHWKPFENVGLYELEYSRNQTFDGAISTVSQGPEQQIKFPKLGRYYVRVRAINSEGKPLSDFSSTLIYELVHVYIPPLDDDLTLHPTPRQTKRYRTHFEATEEDDQLHLKNSNSGISVLIGPSFSVNTASQSIGSGIIYDESWEIGFEIEASYRRKFHEWLDWQIGIGFQRIRNDYYVANIPARVGATLQLDPTVSFGFATGFAAGFNVDETATTNAFKVFQPSFIAQFEADFRISSDTSFLFGIRFFHQLLNSVKSDNFVTELGYTPSADKLNFNHRGLTLFAGFVYHL